MGTTLQVERHTAGCEVGGGRGTSSTRAPRAAQEVRSDSR